MYKHHWLRRWPKIIPDGQQPHVEPPGAYVILYYIIIMLYSIVLYYIILYSTLLYYIMLCCIILYYTLFYSTRLYYIIHIYLMESSQRRDNISDEFDSDELSNVR